jgi:hypothetical protein
MVWIVAIEQHALHGHPSLRGLRRVFRWRYNVGTFGLAVLMVLFLDCLHEFIQLADLLVCIPSAY